MMNERRRDQRMVEEDKVCIEYYSNDPDSEKQEYFALTQDLSIGGAKILADKHFPIGTQIRVTLTLSSSKQIVRVPGMVKWIKESSEGDLYEIGVEFLHGISKTVLSLISHLFGKAKEVKSIGRC
jgi:c-di-GMP-binding flagellar brake protein YcgR